MSDILIRTAGPADSAVVARLAKLDSQRLPRGPMLIAEVCGEAVAALDVAAGTAVADPFRPTADVVELLRVHAAGARARRSRRLGGIRALPRLA